MTRPNLAGIVKSEEKLAERIDELFLEAVDTAEIIWC